MTDNPSLKESNVSTQNSENAYIEQVKQDLWICLVSREISLLGRKEVLSGKAKFGPIRISYCVIQRPILSTNTAS